MHRPPPRPIPENDESPERVGAGGPLAVDFDQLLAAGSDAAPVARFDDVGLSGAQDDTVQGETVRVADLDVVDRKDARVVDPVAPVGSAARSVVDLVAGTARAKVADLAGARSRSRSGAGGGAAGARRQPGRVTPNDPSRLTPNNDGTTRDESSGQGESPRGASNGEPSGWADKGRSGRWAGKGEPGRPAASEDGPDADPEGVARAICLRLLTARARTRQELAQALQRKGIPADAARTVLERFDDVGLIDDGAFAEQWVRSRHTTRGLGRRALAVELRRKGVADDVAGEALAEIDTEAEERRARELVYRKLRNLRTDSDEQRAAAGRKLVGMLARKGYGGGIAYRIVREALAAHGAEPDELAAEPPPDQ